MAQCGLGGDVNGDRDDILEDDIARIGWIRNAIALQLDGHGCQCHTHAHLFIIGEADGHFGHLSIGVCGIIELGWIGSATCF